MELVIPRMAENHEVPDGEDDIAFSRMGEAPVGIGLAETDPVSSLGGVGAGLGIGAGAVVVVEGEGVCPASGDDEIGLYPAAVLRIELVDALRVRPKPEGIVGVRNLEFA